MLSREDNELLVRVGPGTAMGRLMRLYWLPFLPSADVVADGQPQRVRLLGEDLVAFRDDQGKVGLVDYACPHRGAPMVFARNEDQGLRCVYHGWKFAADGSCTEMPAEPPSSPFRKRLRITAYPVRERNGMLWAYMGDDAEPPPLPDIEWNLVPESQVAISMRVQECNWLQALEGEIDSAHAAILHGRHDVGGVINKAWKQAQDLAPEFECVEQPFGVSIASRRDLGEGREYIRVNQYLMPFWTLVPPFTAYPDLSGHAWVPIDDEHTLCLMFSYTPAGPFYEKTRKVFEEGVGGRETGHASRHGFEPRPVTEPYARYWSKYNRGNAYHFDYDAQVSKYNSGLPGLWVQDAACQSGVAAIYDRTKEHLGTTDAGIVKTRRKLLDAVKALAATGTRPQGAVDPTQTMVRAVSLTLPAGTDWQSAGGDFMRARVGADFGYQP